MRFRLLACFCVLSVSLSGRIIEVGPQTAYPRLNALNGVVLPGDTVRIKNGVYSSGTQFLERWQGQPGQPIVIIAEARGQVVFRGGTESLHLIQCRHLIIEGLVIERQTGNGLNIDDGGDFRSPTTHITIRYCSFRDIDTGGNNDLLKLSGLDSFIIEHNTFLNGSAGGSGIDMVGCHYGLIQNNFLERAGTTGIQAKGGSQYITIARNVLKNMTQRALNLGGTTGLEFFRPPLTTPIRNAFEAADIEVFSNVFIGNWAPLAYVGCVRVNVVNNTIYHPTNWVLRILQETTAEGFLPCSDNRFQNNIIFLEKDITEVNIGPNTAPASFKITHNLWYNATSTGVWAPALPVIDEHQIIANPLFTDEASENFQLQTGSPAHGKGLKTSAPLKDFNGNPFSDPPSIGAYAGSISTTSITNQWPAEPYKVSPNPFKNLITIQCPPDQYQLHLVNLQGQNFLLKENYPLPGSIDLKNLPAGIYWLKLTAFNRTRHIPPLLVYKLY